MKKADLGLIRVGFQVQRWHTEGYVHVRETVGHHTSNVIAIIFFLFDDNPPIELIRAALHHDVIECVTGDSPAMAKWGFPEFKAAHDSVEGKVAAAHNIQITLPEHLAPFLHYADTLDAAFKASDEVVAGNQHFLVVLGRLLVKLKEMILGPLADHAVAQQLFQMLLNNPILNIEEIQHDHEEKSNLH